MPDRIAKATRKVERFLHPKVAGEKSGFGGAETWMFAKITSAPDDNGLQSWKRQRIKTDGTFEDFVPATTGDHDAKEINGGTGETDSVYRFIFVGGSTGDNPIKWIFQVGGGTTIVRFSADAAFATSDTTFSATIAAPASMSGDVITVHNYGQWSGIEGGVGYASQIDGEWNLLHPCVGGG